MHPPRGHEYNASVGSPFSRHLHPLFVATVLHLRAAERRLAAALLRGRRRGPLVERRLRALRRAIVSRGRADCGIESVDDIIPLT